MQNFDPDEVIITSTANYVTAILPSTGKIIKSYKVNNVASKCLALLADDYFIAASSIAPDIKMWPVREEKSLGQINSPCGMVGALCVSHSGAYCVAAFKKEIRIWNVQSSEMVASFTSHFQDVTVFKFTNDDSMFISGGKDGIVQVWVLSKVISVNLDHTVRVKPLHYWNNHSKEVTDVHVGVMGWCTRVVTSSTDMTAKIYELDTGLLLTTICFDVPITCVAMDTLQYFLFLGTQKGTICKVNLYHEQPRELHYNTMEKEEVTAHANAVTSLSMSITGQKFVSFSADSIFKVWEVASLTCIKSVTSPDGPYLNAFFTLYPSPLLTRQEPSFYVKQLERSHVESSQKGVLKNFKPQNKKLSLIHVGSYDDCYEPAVLYGHDSLIRSATAAASNPQTENVFQEAFRGETLHDVRAINTQMYAFIMDTLLKSIDPASTDTHAENRDETMSTSH